MDILNICDAKFYPKHTFVIENFATQCLQSVSITTVEC